MASATCMASSRVGTSTSADAENGACSPGVMRWRRGREKAAVFPVPVAAMPSRSLPASSGGMGGALDGSGFLVAERAERLHEGGLEAQLFEGRRGSWNGAHVGACTILARGLLAFLGGSR